MQHQQYYEVWDVFTEKSRLLKNTEMFGILKGLINLILSYSEL